MVLLAFSQLGCGLKGGFFAGRKVGDDGVAPRSGPASAEAVAPPAPSPDARSARPDPGPADAKPAPVVAAPPAPPVTGTTLPGITPAVPMLAPAEFRIGKDDELEISVYANPDLAKTEVVRPDGMIAFPLVGDIQASGLRPDELREELATRLAKFVRDPLVTVIVTKYRSRKVSVLGEVRVPGLLEHGAAITVLEAISRAGGVTDAADLRSAILVRDGRIVPISFDALLRQADFSQNVVLQTDDVILIPNIEAKKAFVLGEVARPLVVPLRPELTLIESISRAGGVTGDADLQGALLLRSGRPMPVSFEKLLKGDLAQNVLLEPNDVILVPNIRDKKVFVLGEVNRPVAMPLRPGTTVVESISVAGGFTRDAQPRSVVVVRGGLGSPRLLTVNVKEIAKDGAADQNLLLQPGDIVYVPKSLIANVVKFFQDVTAIMTPFVLAETGIVLGPAVKAVLQGKPIDSTTPLVINTR